MKLTDQELDELIREGVKLMVEDGQRRENEKWIEHNSGFAQAWLNNEDFPR